MTIRFECRCGQKLKAPDDKIGKKVLCPGCGSPVPVPNPKREAESKPKPVAAKSAAPASTPAGAAAIANQLLKGSTGGRDEPLGKNARSAFSFDEEPAKKNDEGGPPAWLDDVRSFLFTAVPGIVVVIGLAVGGYLLSWRVMGFGVERPPLAYASGTVTLDGQPLVGAIVRFIPQKDRDAKNQGSSSDGTTDEQGHFVLNYAKDVEGAVLGPHRVQIIAYDAQNRPLPSRYNSQSELTADVTEDGENNFTFPLVKKKAAQ